MKSLENIVRKKKTLAACIAALSASAFMNASHAQVSVYEHCNYGGWSEELTAGNHELQGSQNNNISSLKIEPGYEVTLFDTSGQGGPSVTLTEDSSCLVGLNFNDRTTSMTITAPDASAVATLYQHCNFQGYAIEVYAGEYTLSDLLNAGVLNNDVSSIKISEGYKATLFDQDNFSGASISLTGDDSCLVDNNAGNLSFNDVLTSLRVEIDDGDNGGGNGGGNGEFEIIGNCTLDEDQTALIEAHNAARSEGRWCGDEWFDAAPPFRWDCRLATAAQGHSDDMASNNFFSHVGSNGSSFVDRINAQSYPWRGAAENISAGNSTAAAAVQGWLNSTGHCRNIMNSGYEDMGGGVARNNSAAYRIYWTTNFGATF